MLIHQKTETRGEFLDMSEVQSHKCGHLSVNTAKERGGATLSCMTTAISKSRVSAV